MEEVSDMAALFVTKANPTGSILRWHPAHAGFARCNSSCSRTVDGRSFGALSSSCGTLGGGGSGGVFSRLEIMNLPRRIGDVRFATDVNDRKLP